MTSDWLKVYELFNDMSDEDKKRMFEAIKNDMSPDGKSQLVQFITSIRETRFQNGLACIHCGSTNVKRNGKYRSRQRYLCMDKDCGKSFNDISGTPLSGTHKPELWMRYFELMVDNGGKSLPKIAKKLRIHVSTAFYWRHKILNGLRELGHTPLQGIVESDETYILDSEKGKRGGIENRKPRRRGGESAERGTRGEQVCIVVANDRSNGIFSKVVGLGKATAKELDQVMSSYLQKDVVLCTDAATNYRLFAKKNDIHHEVINVSRKDYVKKGIYHINHVNNYHSQLKRWIQRFFGVATRYMDNYLFYHRLLAMYRSVDDKQLSENMLLLSCKKPSFSPIRSFKGVI